MCYCSRSQICEIFCYCSRSQICEIFSSCLNNYLCDNHIKSLIIYKFNFNLLVLDTSIKYSGHVAKFGHVKRVPEIYWVKDYSVGVPNTYPTQVQPLLQSTGTIEPYNHAI